MAASQVAGQSTSISNNNQLRDTDMDITELPDAPIVSSFESASTPAYRMEDSPDGHVSHPIASTSYVSNVAACSTSSTIELSEQDETDGLQRNYKLDEFEFIRTIGETLRKLLHPQNTYKSRLICTGTFGRVCLCRDKLTGKYLAMKILSVNDIIRLKQVEHVRNEKAILKEINHPFLVSLRWHSKDAAHLYMLLDYICGGELFTYLRGAGRFPTSTAIFYASEIITALDYLHSLNIVYRDLKPENLLLDREGHLKITDFGFAKKLNDRTWTLCGTPEYLAPEIIQSKGHNKAVDWWALGILIYEMLAGFPPFYDDNPFGIYEKILSGKIEWAKYIQPIPKDLIKKLLVQDRTKRLGNMKNGADDVKNHRWFKGTNWSDVYNRKVKPPVVPRITYEGDTRNFDEYPELDWKSAVPAKADDQKLFEDF